MRWDDSIFTGLHGEYHWVSSRQPIDELAALVVAEHLGLRLFITAFDSGPTRPNAVELEAGWTVQNDIMISPRLTPHLKIPHEQCDEWYLKDSPLFVEGPVTRYVNYGSFNLADPRELRQSFDATWDPHGLDWLVPLQQQFWQQIELIRPITYVAMGDLDIVVSLRQKFVERVAAALGHPRT